MFYTILAASFLLPFMVSSSQAHTPKLGHSHISTVELGRSVLDPRRGPHWASEGGETLNEHEGQDEPWDSTLWQQDDAEENS